MKKIFGALRLILLAAVIALGIYFAINMFKIDAGEELIENVIGEEVTYFNDKFIFTKGYYKYKDDDNIEYWVSIKTGEFDWLKNPNVKDNDKSVSADEAREAVYKEAMKWDREFFEHDTQWEIVDNTEYEFNIFQIGTDGYKTGKFIIGKVTNGQVEYISMHTEQGMCISESDAIAAAYLETASTDTPLSAEESHLIRTELYKEQRDWVYDIIIYADSSVDILNMKDSINKDKFFVCSIDAANGTVLNGEWVME